MRRFSLCLLLTLSLTPLLAACDGGAAGGPAARPEPPPVPVLIDTVALRPLSIEVATVGSLRSPETTIVSADVSGIIVEINAREGREIGHGHLIARLDDSQAKATLQVAEARERNARIALERAEPLVKDGVVSQQSLDNAVAEMRTAEGLLEEARTRLEKTTIRAPFNGLVGIQTAQLGQYIGSGDPIIELTRMDPLELVFSVPEEQATLVSNGQRIQAHVGRCGEAFEAVVQAIDPKVDPQSRTLAVQARVDNPKRRLRPGMSAQVRLVVGTEEARLVLPREALVAQGTRYLIWTIDAAGVAQPRPVVPGRYLPDVVEIRQGLEPGEKVVVAGHQKLRPGARVSESPWQATENPNLELGTRSGGDCSGQEVGS